MEAQVQDASNINGIALAVLLVMGYLTWALPRRIAFCPLLVLSCLMPLGQEVMFLGLNLHLFRILLLIGMARALVKGEFATLSWTSVDTVFICWVTVSVILGTMAKPSVALFTNRAGEAYNAVGTYFFARCTIREFKDILTSIRVLAAACIPVAALMIVEKSTGHNLLHVFGGVPEITHVREGHLRCQGAFRHPILAGTFGAVQVPLFAALWRQKRLLGLAGLISAVIIVYTSSSSGALLALVAGMAGLLLWKVRYRMRSVRWAVVATIFLLAVVMEAPVWYVTAKLGNAIGGTGWHRAYLIDQAIKHFDEWWVVGTTYTAHWGPGGQVIAANPDMMDITNHYIMQGVSGGMLKLLLFIMLIAFCFRIVGRRIRAPEQEPASAFLVWSLGVALFSHCVAFFSITYFDQTIVYWYWLLATICSLAALQKRTSPVNDSFAPLSIEPLSVLAHEPRTANLQAVGCSPAVSSVGFGAGHAEGTSLPSHPGTTVQ